ncbi:RagB/SusD family nutrient uptake outer membrane protein [Pedobacter heparinus]|uniref:RagB/SusD domain protein n=1 Tax=Pedobacter heparinus (strain ATCC 13125 / DSM 2366 / CIP 104194 / JCM 7457 / NBRC 12017 / NCIMB 9290 / NRRL B-14731 / HIM 762-3) TaxID=485917 RepID=C6XY26_PEDHD|nr:RagB/SusD family nutrient uptake outer membrane protein [Pedobacter heparinus]ACU04444.1 RagB/SusD domain protein [Pedobacter heparinus DSM 2366]
MKKICYLLTLLLAISACKKSGDFLDNKDDSAFTEESVFADSARTMDFLARIYSDIHASYSKSRWDSKGNLEQTCDEAEYRNIGGTEKTIVVVYATFNANNVPFADVWTTGYANIRRANIYLQKADGSPLSAALKARTKAEARFLRAWYYFMMVKTFGGIPIIGDKVFEASDEVNVPRNTYAESVDYLIKELDQIAAALPLVDDYPERDYGRVTRGAALSLKSRILLYAASPLFNGGAITSDPVKAALVSYPAASLSRWADAAKAAEDVINLNQYALMKDNSTPGLGFSKVFLTRAPNPEFIFAQLKPNNKDLENFYNPPSRGGNWYSSPTQNLVNDFGTINGKPIATDLKSPSNPQGYDAANPYSNRDPRMGYTVIYNGALWFNKTTNRKDPVYTFIGAGGTMDSISIKTPYSGSSTGYYCRKMCDENVSANGTATTQRGYAMIRYAEILLNYAEAINESGQTSKAYPKLIEIRDRAGIKAGTDGLYGLKANMSQEEMRAVIQNERRVELAFEEHRFWDVRRWKIAEQTDNVTTQGIKITKSGSTYTYALTPVRKHNFRPAMYVLPIPQTEISKMPALIQNPGW